MNKRALFVGLAATLLLNCTACNRQEDPANSNPEPDAVQNYTAVLVDDRTGTPATVYYGYENTTTLSAIIEALGMQLDVSWDLVSAEIKPTEARLVFGEQSALTLCESEAELRGLLNSVFLTVRQNYGRDKTVYFTVGDGQTRYGIELSGTTPYTEAQQALPEPGEDELSLEDAKTCAINLTYGILGDTSITLSAQLNEVFEMDGAFFYDISVSSAADPDSVMRRFAISLDGLSIYLYQQETDQFERY